MFQLFSDAAYQTKNQHAALAARILVDGQQFEYTDTCTEIVDNHLAEFLAMRLGLTSLLGHAAARHQMVVCHSDSKLVVQSIEKRYVKDAVYQAPLREILALIDQFDLLFVKWVPEKENRAADLLARRILAHMGDKRTSIR